MNHPDRAVALLRVVVGAWFIKAVWTKVSYGVVAGVIPYPMVSPRFIAFHPKRVAEFAAGNPIGWYRDFLQTTVLPHAELFATLQTIRGRRGRRAAARGHDAPGRGRRPVPRAELRSRQPVDELRTTGLPSAAGRLDGDL